MLVALAAPLIKVLLAAPLLITARATEPWILCAVLYFGSAAGILLVTPLLLTWLGPAPSFQPSARSLEYLVALAGLALAALLAKLGLSFYFLVIFPLLAWAALRTGPRGATVMWVALFVVCAWAARDQGETNQVYFSALNFTQGITGLFLAATMVERRRANRDEQSIEGAYRTLVAAAPFAVIGLDGEGRVTVWSSAAERLYGWQASEVVGWKLRIIPTEREGEHRRRLETQGGQMQELETVRMRRDSVRLQVSITSWPLYDSDGRLAGVMEAHQDITERKRAEDAVRSSERELRALFAAMRDTILVLDQNGTYLRVAPTSPVLLPAPADSLLGRRMQDVLPPELAARFTSLIRTTLASGQPGAIEYPLEIDGAEVWFSAVVSPLEGDTVLWVARSINEQKQTEEALRRSEEQLRQSQKMEAVGRLAGGVAHDFNNLLTSVLGHADLALKRVPTSDTLHDDLLEIMSAGTRAAALTQQLLAFSRKQVLEPRVVDLNATVSTIARMLRRTIGEDIDLLTLLAPDLGAVRADPVQMEQVILNLAVNARDAMPLGGQLVIETRNVDLAEGPMVRVRVTDNGVGMTDEVRAHVFEPFYTTKEMGKGTGLGLATAYGIVKQSGGTIAVSSAPGQGSTFLVDLPRVQGESVVQAPAPVPLPGGGTETILLVEDEDAVRNLIRRVLEVHGYKVLTAPSAEAALEVSRLHAGPLDLLLTDVVMPGLSGPKLAERLLVERPAVRIILMSGYAATTLEQKVLLEPASAFLQKPFTSEHLMRRVREVLDQVKQ